MPVNTKSRAVTAVTVATTLTDLLVFDHDQPETGKRNALMGLYSLATVEVKNSHASAHWDQFRVLVKAHASSDWVTMLDTGDYADTSDTLLFVSTPPDALEDGVTCLMTLFIGCPYALKFQAAGATASTGEARVTLST